MYRLTHTMIYTVMLMLATVSVLMADNYTNTYTTTPTDYMDSTSTDYTNVLNKSSNSTNKSLTTNSPVLPTTQTNHLGRTDDVSVSTTVTLTSQTTTNRRNTAQPNATTSGPVKYSTGNISDNVSFETTTAKLKSTTPTIRHTTLINTNTSTSQPTPSVPANDTKIVSGNQPTTNGHVTLGIDVTPQGLVHGDYQTTEDQTGESRENSTSSGRLQYVYDEFEAGDKLWPVGMALTIGVPAIIVLAVTITVLYRRQVAKPRSRMSFYGQNYAQM